jgi:site-specific DNA-methyltransferase (adenine-specific)
MATLPDASVDAVVCDPPYELGFMGKAWDASGIAYDLEVWRQALRVLKPGGHLLAFSGSRTYHRMTCAIEDAGFEIRDQIMWVYGSGFPKSLDVSKAIDKIDRTEAADVRAKTFTAWMRSTGITAQQVNDATGTFMGSHYLTDKSQPSVATTDLFDLLRPLLPTVPHEIEAIVRSRTVESENMKRRKVVGEQKVPIGHAFAGEVYGGDGSEATGRSTASLPSPSRTPPPPANGPAGAPR